MKVGIFIPARLGSTRLPEKLLRDETGFPLIVHTIQRAIAAASLRPDLFGPVVCAVDHPRLAAAAAATGAEVVETAPHHRSGSERLAQAAAEHRYENLDIILNLQGDEPETDPESVVLLAETLAAEPMEVPMATLVTPIRYESDSRWNDPDTVKCVVDARGYALYFSRASLPYNRNPENRPDPRGYHHIGMYAYRRDFLLKFPSLPLSKLEKIEKLEQLRVLEAGFRIRVETVASAAPGIDTEADYIAFVERWKQADNE